MYSVKATKTELNKIIHWSSSKYNEYKKVDVIEKIIFAVEVGEDTEMVLGTGSYSERGHRGGWDYILTIEKGTATLTERKAEDTVYLLEKPKKNKLYTGAKKMKVIKEKYDWHKEILGKEFTIVSETPNTFFFNVALDSPKVMCIDKSMVEIIE